MTREQLIQKHRHEIGGMVLDAAMKARAGAELSLFLRGVYAKIDAILGQAHHDAQPVGTNGKTQAPLAKA